MLERDRCSEELWPLSVVAAAGVCLVVVASAACVGDSDIAGDACPLFGFDIVADGEGRSE